MSIDTANGGAGLALSAFGSTGPSGKRCHMLTDGGDLRMCVCVWGGGGGMHVHVVCLHAAMSYV